VVLVLVFGPGFDAVQGRGKLHPESRIHGQNFKELHAVHLFKKEEEEEEEEEKKKRRTKVRKQGTSDHKTELNIGACNYFHSHEETPKHNNFIFVFTERAHCRVRAGTETNAPSRFRLIYTYT